MAYKEAARSNDPSTQNGAVLSTAEGHPVAFGYNRFPPGIMQTADRWQRPMKYNYIVHAERACLYSVKYGMGRILTCCWASCPNCAQTIIEYGVSVLITHKQAIERTPPRWKRDLEIAFSMLKEARVELLLFDAIRLHNEPILMDGEYWRP
jgi:dCMP deaminase